VAKLIKIMPNSLKKSVKRSRLKVIHFKLRLTAKLVAPAKLSIRQLQLVIRLSFPWEPIAILSTFHMLTNLLDTLKTLRILLELLGGVEYIRDYRLRFSSTR